MPMMQGRTWMRLWRDLAAAPEFYRERRGQPLELTLAVAEPVLSIVLVTTLVAGIAAFLGVLIPVANAGGLTPVAALTAAVAYFYGRRLEWSGVIVREWIVLLVPLIVLWRIVSVLTGGIALDEVRDWLARPATLFDASFVIGAVLLLVAWVQGLGYGRSLGGLHPVTPVRDLRPEPGSAAYWTADEDRRAAYLPPPTAIIARWLQGGLLLAVLSALGASGLRQNLNGATILRLVTFAAPDESAALPNVLAYMLCGVVLVGLAQVSRLSANWRAGGIAVMPGLPRRSLLGLGAVVGVALGAALLLPTQYSLGLGDLLHAVADLLVYAGQWILTLFYGLLALLLIPLSALFHHGHPTLPKAPPLPRNLFPPAAQHGNNNLIGSLAFWIITLMVVGYGCFYLLRHAGARIPALGAIARLAGAALLPFRWLARLALRGLRRGAAGMAQSARRLTARARPGVVLPRGRPSMRRMGPRERVAYLYLSIEERARRLGQPRGSGQTASEYSRHLRESMPDLDPDLAGLTDLFLQARYSPHSFDDAQASGARNLWQRVRARLRARRAGAQKPQSGHSRQT